MRHLYLLVLLAVVMLLPVPAAAAPEPISLDRYQALLKQAIGHLEAAQGAASVHNTTATAEITAARNLLDGTWLVETPAGQVGADLRPLGALLGDVDPATAMGRERLVAAMTVLREHQAAAAEVGGAELHAFPDARRSLDKALADARANVNWWERVVNWLRRLLAPDWKPGDTVDSVARQGWWLKWVALAVGAAGVGMLGFSLWRGLSGQAGGADKRLRKGSQADPNRPVTPDDLWEAARECAARADYKEGLRLAHLSVLRHFDRLTLLRYDPAQTNREHGRMLRRRNPELARAMNTLTDLVENRLYSGHGASADDFARAESLATQLWREGDAASKGAQAPTGASSSAPSP